MPAYQDDSGRWRYRFAYKGDRHSGSAPKGANTKKAAEKLEREHLEKLMSNQYTGVMPTVAEFVEKFLAYQKARVKPLTYELNENQLKLHLVPHLGKAKLDAIGALELDTLVTRWKESAEPTTINSRLGTVGRMFAIAVEWKMLRAVPPITLLDVPDEAPRFLSEAEAAELLAASKYLRVDSNDWYSMILVGLRTGLRIGELRGLQWADLDLARASLHVRRTDPGRPDLVAGAPKGNRTRVVPLTPDAIDILRARLADEKNRLGRRWAISGFVWPMRSDNARPVATGSCSGAMDRLTTKAKLEGVGWHTLRHTYASWLVMRGVPLPVVQQLLGHYDIKQTMKYAHLAPGFAHASAVAALDVPLVTPAQMALPPPANDTEHTRTPAKKQSRQRPRSQRAAKKAPKAGRRTPPDGE